MKVSAGMESSKKVRFSRDWVISMLLALVSVLAVPPVADAAPLMGTGSPVQTALDFSGFPANEYEYSLRRDAMLAAERQFEGRNLTLNTNETIVSRYLSYLRWKEFEATKVSGFPPARPIEQMLGYIPSTEIYQALKTLPKGGNMHNHEDHQLSKRTLLEIIWDSSDFQYLWMLPGNHSTSPYTLDFYVNPPDGNWTNVKNANLSVDDVLPYQTLLGIMASNATCYPTDSGMRWTEINPLWGRGSTQLVSNYNIKIKYLQAIYEHGLEEGLIYHEMRKNFGAAESLYVMDPSGNSSATHGKRYLDVSGHVGDLDVDLAVGLSVNLSAADPYFVGHRRISYTFRQNPIDGQFQDEMANVYRLHRRNPDHVLGFDMVGQEDAGYATLHYLERFFDPAMAGLPLYLHGSETNWPDELIASDLTDDPLSALQNSVDALLLQTHRVGHGLGLIKHPYRLEVIRQRQIAIEVCPVSNQMLGFVPDLRQHPALHYFRSGIPIIIGSDDPGTMGYDNITVDWYDIYMAWGLDLGDLKRLAMNSFDYSGMSSAERDDAKTKRWQPMWDAYILSKTAEACNYPISGDTPSFIRLLPRAGANRGTTTVHVYGRNFHQAICKPVACQFGDTNAVSATYVDHDHIICEAPAPPDTTERTVAVQVRLDFAFQDTGLNFTYKYDPVVLPTEPTPTTASPSPNGSNRVAGSGTGLVLAALSALAASFARIRLN